MIPVTLVGNNLGERHRYLNTAVNEAYKSVQDFGSIEGIPEKSVIDRIFKINLASKLRNIDYIIKNLKDDDMLYVSKSLRCKWLLDVEYEHIINPEYLEDYLYPSMITTAVTKMKHWVFLNLKDPVRCQRFFIYYCDTDFKLAVKFLRNCSIDVVKEQFPKQIHKISPHDFKILCEKNPIVAKLFFDALLTDEVLIEKYLSNEKQYLTTLKSLLKSDGTMVLDLEEKYFNKHIIKPFSSKATKFIMKHYRSRFTQKPELYTAFLLNLKTLASCLNSEDATRITLALARDNYLISQQWFDYKKVEPIIKRIKPENRADIKKKVFVDKEIGIIVQQWPYEMPSSPTRATKILPIFEDYEHDPYEYRKQDFRCMLKKRKYAKWAEYKPGKTMLDKLFDEYRVVSYDKVLFELRKKLKAESSAQNRQYMMLVLVSKSGGHENYIASLMRVLSDYKNEPPQLRAAVVRSLVKRARVWRAPEDTWNQLLDFSHGLGLDGKQPEAECIEGIHAVVIRQILANGTCDPEILSIYLKNFSTLEQYSFSKGEKNIISDLLPKILYTKVCEETEIQNTEIMINKLLDTLTTFRLDIETYPGLISKIGCLAKSNLSQFGDILKRLFSSRIARRDLFKVNFAIIDTEDSYLNALRHDIDVISTQKLVKLILFKNTSNYQRLFLKISIYFSEQGGIAKKFLNVITEPYHKMLAKPLAILLGDELTLYVKNVDKSVNDIKCKMFAAALRANVHLARPAFNIDTFGWSAIGTKAVANKVLLCRNTEVNNYVQKLLQNKQTVKLAYLVAEKNSTSIYFNCFTVLSKMKPTVALKMGLKILSHDDNNSANQAVVWDKIKPLIEFFDIDSNSKKYFKLPAVSSMPVQIRPAYSVIRYTMCKKKSLNELLPFLCHIENLLPNVSEEFIENELVGYLNDDWREVAENCKLDCNCIFIRIIIKYMLLSKTEESQKKRYELIGAVFFGKMATWLNSDELKNPYRKYLHEFLAAFRYYKVFLNDEYVSCMPVMIKSLTWMKQNLPIEDNFKEFVHMHLNMLYYTAIRKSIDLLPKHRIDDENQMEARSMVGNIFGKYLAREINNLKITYFNSVPYLYTDIILNLQAYFLPSCEILTQALINGVLDESGPTGNVLAVYLFKERRFSLGAAPPEDVLLRLRKCEDIEMQMIFFAETFLQI